MTYKVFASYFQTTFLWLHFFSLPIFNLKQTMIIPHSMCNKEYSFYYFSIYNISKEVRFDSCTYINWYCYVWNCCKIFICIQVSMYVPTTLIYISSCLFPITVRRESSTPLASMLTNLFITHFKHGRGFLVILKFPFHETCPIWSTDVLRRQCYVSRQCLRSTHNKIILYLSSLWGDQVYYTLTDWKI